VLSESRYRNGLVSQLDLLDAQRSELSNRRQALQVRSAQYQATVGLVRALGGGWDPAPAAEPAPAAAAPIAVVRRNDAAAASTFSLKAIRQRLGF
jgi:multidrug efflux system outer membrane protein